MEYKMKGLNIVFLMGYCADDPKITRTTSGQSLTKVTIAAPNRVQDGTIQGPQGPVPNWVDRPDYIQVTAWGAEADYIGQYAKKGALINIEGKLKINKWSPKDQPNKVNWETTVVVVKDGVKYLGRPPVRAEQQYNAGQSAGYQPPEEFGGQQGGGQPEMERESAGEAPPDMSGMP